MELLSLLIGVFSTPFNPFGLASAFPSLIGDCGPLRVCKNGWLKTVLLRESVDFSKVLFLSFNFPLENFLSGSSLFDGHVGGGAYCPLTPSIGKTSLGNGVALIKRILHVFLSFLRLGGPPIPELAYTGHFPFRISVTIAFKAGCWLFPPF